MRLLRSVDGFVLPSVDEGVPLALQEAMAAGLPVVTTMQPGYERYFAADDVLPVRPEAGDVRRALRTLALDPVERRRLGERAGAVAAAHFGPAAFIEAYERLLLALAQARLR